MITKPVQLPLHRVFTGVASSPDWQILDANGTVVARMEPTATKATESVMKLSKLFESSPELANVLRETLPALIRLGDFVGNVDPGGPSGQGCIDRCALILKVRRALERAGVEP